MIENTALPPLTEMSPRHQAYVTALVARLGVSPAHEREDVVQEVMLQAYRSRENPHGLEPRALLFGITRHVIFRWITRREHEQKKAAVVVLEPPLVESVEETYEAAERRRLVRETIERLPPDFRDVMQWVEIDGLSMEDAARAVGINVNTGHSRLRLARAQFTAAIRRHAARLRATERL